MVNISKAWLLITGVAQRSRRTSRRVHCTATKEQWSSAWLSSRDRWWKIEATVWRNWRAVCNVSRSTTFHPSEYHPALVFLALFLYIHCLSSSKTVTLLGIILRLPNKLCVTKYECWSKNQSKTHQLKVSTLKANKECKGQVSV